MKSFVSVTLWAPTDAVLMLEETAISSLGSFISTEVHRSSAYAFTVLSFSVIFIGATLAIPMKYADFLPSLEEEDEASR